jgi:hypothetical protein
MKKTKKHREVKAAKKTKRRQTSDGRPALKVCVCSGWQAGPASRISSRFTARMAHE